MTQELLIKDDDKVLRQIAFELMFSTPQNRSHSEGLTSVEIARKLKINSDVVKKKLKILYDKRIIRCMGVNPKFWLFDEYAFQRMDISDPVYLLLCNFDDIDFDDYYIF